MHGTYHKCLVLKLVSEVHMAYKVLAPLIRVAPGHRGTDWTYLGWQGHQYELESWLAKKGRRWPTKDSLQLAWYLLTCSSSPEQSMFC